MTEKFVASKYVGKFVVVRNPDLGTEWTGRIVEYHEMPSVTLEQADGFRLSLPAAWVRRAGEPKPWHDAKPGEVWAIVTDNVAEEVAVQRTPNGLWQFCDGVVRDDKLPIFSARRIWPVSDV